ncbi:MAG: bacteriocin [Streptococcus salivarius]
MLIELTYKELEAIQGGAVCRMPNVNNKEGDPLKEP